MRLEYLLKLIESEQLKRGTKKPIVIADNNNVGFVSYLGISDEDIKSIIVPLIVDLQMRGELSKEKLKQFILAHDQIKRLPKAVRVRHALDDIDQRRMDSFSRLLSVDVKYTPCIAVALYNGEIIVSSNAPNPKEQMTDSQLSDCLVKKMSLIQEFLRELTKDVVVGSQPNVSKIQFSARAKLLATKAVLEIIAPENGGVGKVVPMVKGNRHKDRKIDIDHMRNALLKLGQHCLFSLLTVGKKGFNSEELFALLKADSTTVVTPNTKVLKEHQLHAEQAILSYLRENTDFTSKPSAKKVHLGISKLCCQACHEVLNRYDAVISYRGSHGMKFPNVYDIDTNNLFEGINTKLGDDLCPSDSDSECEFISAEENNEESDNDEAVPSLESLFTKTNTAKFFKTSEKLADTFSFFKKGAEKVADSSPIKQNELTQVAADPSPIQQIEFIEVADSSQSQQIGLEACKFVNNSLFKDQDVATCSWHP